MRLKEETLNIAADGFDAEGRCIALREVNIAADGGDIQLFGLHVLKVEIAGGGADKAGRDCSAADEADVAGGRFELQRLGLSLKPDIAGGAGKRA